MGLDDFYEKLSEEEKAMYTEIADTALRLGYKPVRAKTQSMNYVFSSSRTRKHLLKFSFEQDRLVVKMKFYAAGSYSPLFHEAVKAVVEEFDYKYTGCYHCGKCADELEGYQYVYPDGRRYFRCGSELISLPAITPEDVPEIRELLERQHLFYLAKLNRS